MKTEELKQKKQQAKHENNKEVSRNFSVYMKESVYEKTKLYKEIYGRKSVNEAIEELIEKGLNFSLEHEEKYLKDLKNLKEKIEKNDENILELITQNEKILKETNSIKAMLNRGLSNIYWFCGSIFTFDYETTEEENRKELDTNRKKYLLEMPMFLRGKVDE